MSRTGTCRHARQFEWIERDITARRRESQPNEYHCGWFEQFGALPPAIERWSLGGHAIKSGDCEACPHYEPPDALEKFMRK